MFLVANPDEPVTQHLDGPEELVWDKTGILDSDDRLDLGQLNHELGRPALRVVGHQRKSRRPTQLVEVVPGSREVGGNLGTDQRWHPETNLHAQPLVAAQQFDRFSQVRRQAGDDQRPAVNGPQGRADERFEIIKCQRFDLAGSTPHRDHLHAVFDQELEVPFEAGQVEVLQIVGERSGRVGVNGLESVAEFGVVWHWRGSR